MKHDLSPWIPALILVIGGSACEAPAPLSSLPASPAPLPRVSAPRGSVADTYHGVRVEDPYRWLEDPEAEATRAWVAAQNQRTQLHLDDALALGVRERLSTLWSFERVELPTRRGGRTFVRRNDGSQNQGVLFAQEPDGSERLLFDPNEASPDGTLALVDVFPSRDGELLALGFSDGGSDWRLWRTLEVASGQELPQVITGNKFGGLRWAANGAGFYYPRTDRPAAGDELVARNAPPDIVYHELGTSEEDDLLVLARPRDSRYSQGFEVGSDGRALFVLRFEARSRNNELLRVPVDPRSGLPTGPPETIVSGFDARFRYVADEGDTLWLLTDLDAPNWRIVAIDLNAPQRERWREVVPEGRNAVRDARGYGGRLVVSYLDDASSRVDVFGSDGTREHEIELPELGTVRSMSGTWSDPTLYLSFESFLSAPSVLRHDLAAATTSLLHRPELDFQPEPFVTRQVFYASADGTQVPLFLTHRRDLEADGTNPTYLFGYGGFNISITPFFSPAHLFWLEQGGVLAVANLRGGGEYGETWHRAGTLLEKQNVFDDFQAAAEWLIAMGITRPERLAIGGRSNGGLLVGACLTQRPELYGAALPVVGVLDMLRYHLFTIGWAWAGDYGTVENEAEVRALRAYSPLHNVRAGTRYPATFISTGDHDDRVVPAHSYKFAAALQHAQGGAAPILLRVDTRAGHGRGKPIAMQVAEAADRWAFVLQTFSMELDR